MHARSFDLYVERERKRGREKERERERGERREERERERERREGERGERIATLARTLHTRTGMQTHTLSLTHTTHRLWQH